MFLITTLLLSLLTLDGTYCWPVYYDWPAYKAPAQTAEAEPKQASETPTQAPSGSQIPTPQPGTINKSLDATTPSKPIVWIYSSPSYCPPCERAKADARAGKFQFELREGTPPPDFEIESYPTFHWNGADGKGRRWPRPNHPEDANYLSPKHLNAIWKSTQ